jgi:hypothetical protein
MVSTLVLTINISLHSDNRLYADCALSIAESDIHPLVLTLSHTSSPYTYTIIIVTFIVITPTPLYVK